MLRRKRREMRKWADTNKKNKHSLQNDKLFKIPFRNSIKTVPINNNCNDNKDTRRRIRTNIPIPKYHRKTLKQCENNSIDIANRENNIKTPVIGMPPIPLPLPLPLPPSQPNCDNLNNTIISQKELLEQHNLAIEYALVCLGMHHLKDSLMEKCEPSWQRLGALAQKIGAEKFKTFLESSTQVMFNLDIDFFFISSTVKISDKICVG